MDWTRILAAAGIAEPPGRAEAVQEWEAKREVRRLQRVAVAEAKKEKEQQRLAKGAHKSKRR